MKRPFAVFCAALAALSLTWGAAVHPDRDGPPREGAALLREEAGDGGRLTLAGTVAKCSAVSSGIRLSVDHLTIQRNDNSEQSLLPDLNVTITTEDTELLPGDEILASGKAIFRKPATNPGQFDAQAYYFAQNSVCMLGDAQILKLRPGRMSLARALYTLRRRLGRSLEAILDEEQAHVTEAICLGERDLLTQEWKEFYREGGIAHILAISGLHISLIGMCLYRLLRRLGAGFGVSCAGSGAAVALYVLMSGAGVSAVRALIMFAFWLGAQFLGRKYDMLTAAAASAMLLLLADAGNLTQSSFLLSFTAVLTIALLLPCLERSFLGTMLPRLERSFLRTLLPGFAIWLGTLPVTLYFFYQAVPWSVLINLAVVPLMTVLMACGLAAGVIGLFCVPAGVFCAAPVHYLLGLFELLCRLKEGLPMSVWVAGRPAVWRIALYYGILLAVGMVSYRLADAGTKRGKGQDTALRDGGMCRLRRWKRGESRVQKAESHNGRVRRPGRWKRRESRCNRDGRSGQFCRTAALCLLWTGCSAACVSLMSAPDTDRLEITCLDVGQGDAALLRLPGGVSCLVDGGSSSESEVWTYRIGQTAKYYGVRTLDYIFLSHADEDHINGIEEYLREYEPGFAGENVHGVTLKNLVLPPTADPEDFGELHKLAREKGIRVLRMEAGDRIGERAAREEKGWSIACLAPDAASLTGERNEDSMVLMLRYGEFCMLFTGDLEGAGERRLADSEEDLSADVLKVGHHGSKNASLEGFLTQVSPQIAVISCGENNSYGHPAPETVERLRNAGCRILQTMRSGAVMITSDGERYSVETYLTDGQLPSA